MGKLDYLNTIFITSRKIKNGGLAILICWGLIGPNPGFCNPSQTIESALIKLDQHIQRQVQKKQIPGCAVAVVYRNKIIFINSYGVKTLGKKEKIDLDTVFQLGSVSKPVAATLASILENKGYLKLDDPVNHYLPDFSLNSTHSFRSLKIKHVLSHSTGVPRGGFNNLIESHAPPSRILKALQNTPVRTPVGRRYDYHNAMYSLISDITQSATGLSFKDSLHINLLKPLNMTNTSSTFSGLMRTNNRATPHVKGKNGALIPCNTYSQGYYNVAPAGGINSSIRDMAIFLKAQLGGYPEIISHRVLTRIQTPQVPTQSSLSTYEGPANLIKNARYALGWRVVDFAHHKLVFHAGWVKGFTNFIALMPEHQIGIVVLHNGESKFSSKTAVKFFESLLDVQKPKKSLKLEKNSKVAKLRQPFKHAKPVKKKLSKKQLKLKTVSTHTRTKAPYESR